MKTLHRECHSLQNQSSQVDSILCGDHCSVQLDTGPTNSVYPLVRTLHPESPSFQFQPSLCGDHCSIQQGHWTHRLRYLYPLSEDPPSSAILRPDPAVSVSGGLIPFVALLPDVSIGLSAVADHPTIYNTGALGHRHPAAEPRHLSGLRRFSHGYVHSVVVVVSVLIFPGGTVASSCLLIFLRGTPACCFRVILGNSRLLFIVLVLF